MEAVRNTKLMRTHLQLYIIVMLKESTYRMNQDVDCR